MIILILRKVILIIIKLKLVYVKQNQVFLSDSIWLGSQGSTSELSFYSIEKIQTILSDSNYDNSYMQVFISLSQQIDQSQRTVA